jgi:hypothetical protein
LMPQMLNVWDSLTVEDMIRVVLLHIEKYKINPDRVYIHGLSIGGYATYEAIKRAPWLFAAALPMSAVTEAGNIFKHNQQNKVAHIPLWTFQGGLDDDPSPAFTQATVDKFKAAGASIKLTVYPDLGHRVWGRAYQDADFFTWILSKKKNQIHALHGVTQIDNDKKVYPKLVLPEGFFAYQWEHNGTLIASATTNQYSPTLAGSYRARFSRKASPTATDWNNWSAAITITSVPATTPPPPPPAEEEPEEPAEETPPAEEEPEETPPAEEPEETPPAEEEPEETPPAEEPAPPAEEEPEPEAPVEETPEEEEPAPETPVTPPVPENPVTPPAPEAPVTPPAPAPTNPTPPPSTPTPPPSSPTPPPSPPATPPPTGNNGGSTPPPGGNNGGATPPPAPGTEDPNLSGEDEEEITGVEDDPTVSISVYPNPTNTKRIELDVIGMKDGYTVRIIDLLGAVKYAQQFSSSSQRIMVENIDLQDGLYNVIISTGSRRYARRLVVQQSP